MNDPIDRTAVRRFQEDGFVGVPDLVGEELVDFIRGVAEQSPAFQERVRTGSDYEGNEVKLWITNDVERSPLGAIVRYDRMVAIAEALLGEEVYPWHHKMILKAPRVGGAWEWHQDYGYWYDYGCLFPHLVSCMIAIDPATRENGCLQVVRGSHRLGRLDTSRAADQTGIADGRRIESILERLELVHCEMSPGDALFFHANTLHRSAANRGRNRRWAFISVYNAASNAPGAITPIHAHDPDAPPTPYFPLERWSLDRIRAQVATVDPSSPVRRPPSSSR